MRTPLLVLVLMLAALPARAQHYLRGQVLDHASGEPIQLANVLATRLADGALSGVATGEQGAFALELAAGRHALLVSYVGAESFADTLDIPMDDSLVVRLVTRIIDYNPITVTASRRPQRALDSPSRVTVLDARQLGARIALTASDHLVDAPAVDVMRTGLNQSRVVVRGFNDNLASSLLTLVDHRIARAPAVRLTAMQLIPMSAADLERMEVVSGPASALYGPNAANGVVHIMTKSPFDSPGTSFMLSGGQQSLRSGSVRHASRVGSRWAYKLNAQYYSGHDFEYFSPAEEEARIAALAAGAQPDTLRIGARDFNINNLALSGRVEGRLDGGWLVQFDAGSTRGDNIEVTPTGAAQVDGARVGFLQARASRGTFFAQAYGNFLNSGDSYFLRTGESFIDKSRLYVVQAQHRSRVRRVQLAYGVDYFRTLPDNDGTVSGGYEDSDQSNEVGAYLQGDVDLADRVALTLAGRADYHDRLEEVFVSPRAGLVFRAQPQHTIRLTYNRAFKAPASNQLFGDVLGLADAFGLGGLGAPFGVSGRTDLRAQGMFGGFSFMRGTDGRPMFRSPFAVNPERYWELDDPAMTAQMWSIARFASVAGLADNLVSTGMISAADAAGMSAALSEVLPEAVLGVANQMQVLDLALQQFVPVSDVADLPQLTVTRTETVELGYKGLVGRSLVLGVDAYWSRIRDFVGPLFVGTPNVFLEPGTLSAALGAALPGALAASPSAAAALLPLDSVPFVGNGNGSAAEEIAFLVATGVAGAIPFGTVSPVEAFDPTAVVLMRRNYGDISLWGVDGSATLFLSRALRVSGTMAWVSSDLFAAGAGQGLGVEDVALNAPTMKFGVAAAWSRGPWEASARVRGANGYPVRSDVYVGAVEAFSVVDVAASYRVRRDSRLSLTVQNLLDERFRQFVDVAELGRLAVLRLEVGI